MIATKPLTELTAMDVMSRNVITVPQTMPLQEAARLLAREQISGAPVVDDAGHCVGILSATDFLHWAEGGAAAVKHAAEPCYFADWQVIDLETLPRDQVRYHMSVDLVVAQPDLSIIDLARRMLDAHIHRIVVLDGSRHPVGVVSSTDILAAVAYAAEAN
jgi:CBS-domain-containing membrane protein